MSPTCTPFGDPREACRSSKGSSSWRRKGPTPHSWAHTVLSVLELYRWSPKSSDVPETPREATTRERQAHKAASPRRRTGGLTSLAVPARQSALASGITNPFPDPHLSIMSRSGPDKKKLSAPGRQPPLHCCCRNNPPPSGSSLSRRVTSTNSSSVTD